MIHHTDVNKSLRPWFPKDKKNSSFWLIYECTHDDNPQLQATEITPLSITSTFTEWFTLTE